MLKPTDQLATTPAAAQGRVDPPVARMVIESLGVYLPERRVTSQQVAADCVRARRLPLERLTGIKSRPVAAEGEGAFELARRAASRCLDAARLDAGDIDLVIACNISRFHRPHEAVLEPSLATRVCRALGLQATAFDVGNACAGFFTAMGLAECYLQTGSARSALVVSGEYISNLMTAAQAAVDGISHPQLASLTVGDSGVAALLQLSDHGEAGFHRSQLFTRSEHSRLCIGDAGPRTDGRPAMHTEVTALQDEVMSACAPHVLKTLDEGRWESGRVDAVIPHQTSVPSVRTVARRLNEALGEHPIDDDKYLCSAGHYGNLATNSHLVALWHFIHHGRIRSHDKIAFLIGASGLTMGTALYQLDDLPDRLRAANGSGRCEPPSSQTGSEVVAGPRRRPSPPRANGHAVSQTALRAVATAPAVEGEDVIASGARAALACFGRCPHSYAETDLLIFCGVRRDRFLAEPAAAALLDDRLRDATGGADPSDRRLSLDLLHGAIGVAQACQVASRMIACGRCRQAVIVAAEAVLDRRESPGCGPRSSAMVLRAGHGVPALPGRLRVAVESLPGAADGPRTVADFTNDARLQTAPALPFGVADQEAVLALSRGLLEGAGVRPDDLRLAVSAPQPEVASRLADRLGLPCQRLVHVCDGRQETSSLAQALEASWVGGLARRQHLLHLQITGGLQAAATLLAAPPGD